MSGPEWVTVVCVNCGKEFLLDALDEIYAEPKLCSQKCADEWTN